MQYLHILIENLFLKIYHELDHKEHLNVFQNTEIIRLHSHHIVKPEINNKKDSKKNLTA